MAWAGIALLAGAFLILLLNADRGTTLGLQNDDFASVISALAILILIGGGLLASYRHNVSKAVKDLAIWMSIFLLIGAGYAFRFEFETIYNRLKSEFFVSAPTTLAADRPTVAIQRAQSGQFELDAKLTGPQHIQTLRLLVDTGASRTVLTAASAEKLGFDLKRLRFSQTISTANGLTQVAPIRIQRLEIGPIILLDVPASVAKPADLGSGHINFLRYGG